MLAGNMLPMSLINLMSPVDTPHRFNVDTTSFNVARRLINVETSLCVYRLLIKRQIKNKWSRGTLQTRELQTRQIWLNFWAVTWCVTLMFETKKIKNQSRSKYNQAYFFTKHLVKFWKSFFYKKNYPNFFYK